MPLNVTGLQGSPAPGEGMTHTLVLRKGREVCSVMRVGSGGGDGVHRKGPEHPFFSSR